MTIGCVHPGTRRGTFLAMIGSRKITPPRMLRIVPLGERHISFRLNSATRASSGVMVAQFDPGAMALDRLGGIHGDLVAGLVPVLHGQVVIIEVDVEIRMDERVADGVPNDAGHLVTVELDDGVRDLDLAHAL